MLNKLKLINLSDENRSSNYNLNLAHILGRLENN